MFLCVSLNPAIDKRLRMDELRRGQMNRVRTAEAFAGGKAAHVAMLLRTLGETPQWIGPCGGAAGEEVLNGLAGLGIQATGIPIRQSTRTNLEILEKDGTLTEVLEPGPALNSEEWAALEAKCEELFRQGAERLTVIFSGSLPQGAEATLYARLIAAARARKCTTLLDTSGEALQAGLSARPSLVKPNREEVGQVLGMSIGSAQEGVAAVRQIFQLGAEGLLFCVGPDEPVLYAAGLPVKCGSAVGCGDSAVAGFAWGLARGLSAEETLRRAAACATANCVADSPGAARGADIRKFQERVAVEQL